MAWKKDAVRYAVYQIGALSCSLELRNSLELANQIQPAFSFDFKSHQFDLSNKHLLANGGYDLDSAVSALLQQQELPQPRIFITSQPYSDRENQQDPHGFIFGDYYGDKETTIISTHLWQQLHGEQRIQPYILLTLAEIAFARCAGLSIHYDTRECPFDYCNEPSDIDKSIKTGELCPEC